MLLHRPNLTLLLNEHCRVGILLVGGILLLIGNHFALSSRLRLRVLKCVTLSEITLCLSKCSKPLSMLLQLGVMRFISNQRQIIVGVLHAELRCSTLSIYHLWIVVIPLSLNLLTCVLCKNVLVRLLILHHVHVSIDGWSCVLLYFVRFKLLAISLSRRDNGFLGIGRADIVLLVSLCRSDSVISIALVLVAYLNHLLLLHGDALRIVEVRITYRVLECCCLVEGYLNSSIRVSCDTKKEIIRWVKYILTCSLLDAVVKVGAIALLISVSCGNEDLFIGVFELYKAVITLILGNYSTRVLHGSCKLMLRLSLGIVSFLIWSIHSLVVHQVRM